MPASTSETGPRILTKQLPYPQRPTYARPGSLNRLTRGRRPSSSGGKADVRAPAARLPTPYALLVEALARTGQVGMCKVAVRSRERIALLRPRHGMLILQTLLWQDELRDPGDPSAPVTDRELELAEVLMHGCRGRPAPGRVPSRA
ncbi:Ku protein [Streptomyces sp. NPDC055134]